MRPQEGAGKSLWVLVLAEPGSELAGRLAAIVTQASPTVRVEVPHSAREAARLLKSARWDLILWHVTSPFLSGPHGLEAIKNRQPSALVVAVASEGDAVLAMRALAGGADSYLPADDEAAMRAGVEAVVERIAGASPQVQASGPDGARRADILAALTQDAVFVASLAGSIIRANKRAEELTGRPLESLLGVPLDSLFYPREVVAGAVAAAASLQDQRLEPSAAGLHGRQVGPVSRIDAFLLEESGSCLRVSLSLAPVLARSGTAAELVAVATPQASQEPLREELEGARALATLVAAAVSDAIALVDSSGVVVMANPAMARMLGFDDPLDCIGLRVDSLAAGGNLQDALSKALQRGRPVGADLYLAGPGTATTRVRGRVLPAGDVQGASPRVLLVLEQPAPEPAKAPGENALPALRRAVEAAIQDTRCQLDAAVESLVQVAAQAFSGMGVGLVALGGQRPAAAWRGFSESLGRSLVSSVVARLARTNKPEESTPLIVPDLASYAGRGDDPALVASLVAEGWRSCVFMPLMLAGRVLGMFVVASTEPQRQIVEAAPLEQFALYLSMALSLLVERRLTEGEKRWFEQFAEFSNEVAVTPELDKLVGLVAREAVRIFEADWAVVYLVQPGHEGLEVAANAEAEKRSERKAPIPAEVFPVASEALEQTALIVRLVTINGADTTLAAARFSTDGEATGVLVVGWDEVRVLDDLAKRALELVARRVGVAIHHARAYEEEASRVSRMKAAAEEAMEVEARVRSLLWAASAAAELTDLNRVLWTLTDAGLRTVNVEEIRIYLADHEAGVLRGATVGRAPDVVAQLEDTIPLQRTASVRADAALSEAPYLVSVVEEAGKSYETALIPLRTHAALVGLLEGSNPDTGRPVAPREMRLLRMLASLAAVAIDRARMDALREAMERSVSHELRTPLSSIRAYTELLLDEGAGPLNDEQRLFLQRVATACEYLQTLVEDLLDLSRLRAGEVQVRPTLLDLRELIEEVLDRLGQRIEEAGASVDVDVAPEVTNVVSDPTRLSQILTNLIDNAIKFSPPPAKVAVRATLDGADVAISVTDNGPGIPESEREAIFREFYRGKSDGAQSRAGAGLGLAIARRVARLLGGDLTLDSEVGKGSTFWVRFPYRYPEISAEEDVQAQMRDSDLAQRQKHPDH